MGHQVSKVFKQDSVAKSLILCVLTLGCYLIFKLFYFSKTINQATQLKISNSFIAITVLFFTCSFVSLIYGLINIHNPLILKSHIGLHVISSILDVTWIVMVRNRINAISESKKGDKLWLNPVTTSIFHVIYIQYKINQSYLKT